MKLFSSVMRSVTVFCLALPLVCQAAPAVQKSDYLVKCVYFLPNNRVAQPDAERKLKDFILFAQQVYSLQMAKNGHFKPGTTQGKTFAYEADENGQPVIHILRGKHNDSFYWQNIWVTVTDEVKDAYPLDESVIFVVPETQRLHSDSSFTPGAGAFLGGQWNTTGGIGGIGMVGSDALWFLDHARMSDDRPYDGVTLPGFNKYAMKYGVSQPKFIGPTVSTIASSYTGGAMHELGHAFGLQHCFLGDSNFCGDMMGNGFRGLRGNFSDNYPGESMILSKPDADMLAMTRYFNPGEPLREANAPVQDVQVTLVNPLTADKAIRVKVKAEDKDSGLWRSIVYAMPPDSSLVSHPFDKLGEADYLVKSADVPRGGLTPGSYTLTVSAIDNQGNRATQDIWVPIPEKLEVKSQANDKLRVEIAMSSNIKSAMLTPEVEIQPLGTPYTGKANYTGESVAFDGSSVVGQVDFELPKGDFHWQYRIRTDKTIDSCWVDMGSKKPEPDIIAPVQHVEATLENAANSNPKLNVRVVAYDQDSGLSRSEVSLASTQFMQNSKFNDVGVAQFSLNSIDPKSYDIEIVSFDNQNNKTTTPVWVPVPEKVTLQYLNGNEWTDLRPGEWAPCGDLRLVVSMSASENEKLTPEIEVRPIGVGFSGEPNFVGQSVDYSGKSVDGTVNMNLQPGPYHYRYRFKNDKGEHSCWIYSGSSTNPIMDFGVK